jgi:hypothetical protein
MLNNENYKLSVYIYKFPHKFSYMQYVIANFMWIWKFLWILK